VLISGANGRTFESVGTSFTRLSNSALVTRANTLHATGLAGPTRVSHSFGINGSGRRTLTGLDNTTPECPKGISDPTGDGTVPTASSSMFLTRSAYLYVDEEHKNLPGNPAVQQQVLNILNEDTSIATGLFTVPKIASDGWVWYSCSPIRTNIYDDGGKHDGLDQSGALDEQIADSSHFVFPHNEGGFLPFDKSYAVAIDAFENGLFTLGFTHVTGVSDLPTASVVYAGIPISIHTHGTISLSPSNSTPILSLDVNGDGKVDFTIAANQKPSSRLFAAVLIDVVNSLNLPRGISESFLVKLNAAADALSRGDTMAAKGQLGALLNDVTAQTGNHVGTAQGSVLLTLIQGAINAL
jgi:hypothetical protein